MKAIELEFLKTLKQDRVNPELLSVFSDWLQKRGDFRGKIIALEVALQSNDSKNQDALRQELKHLETHNRQQIGLPDLVSEEFYFKWQHGFITHIRVDNKHCLNVLGSIHLTAAFKYLLDFTLEFEYEYLDETPDWIGNLSQLTSLWIRYCKSIGTLSNWIGKLTQLTTLVLSKNNLDFLPESIGQLTRLTYLDVSHNNLSMVPKWIINSNSLETIDISNNNFKKLPDLFKEKFQPSKFITDRYIRKG